VVFIIYYKIENKIGGINRDLKINVRYYFSLYQ
jgi:hypothetical protein